MKWSAEMDAFFAEIVPGHSEREIRAMFAERFGIELTEAQIGNRKHKLGVKSGTNGGRFQKGHATHNKGKKWADFMSADGMEASRKTQYKPGNIPLNALDKPIGYERVGNDGYIEVKVKDGLQERPSDNFELKHRIVWERHTGGKVPEGCVIMFADGDKRNFDPANLVCVSRSLLATINHMGLKYHDAESLYSAMAVARLRSGISKARKSLKEKRKGEVR